ncbi:MAG: hypothetical protein VB140_10055 [Burkholderia sp.]
MASTGITSSDAIASSRSIYATTPMGMEKRDMRDNFLTSRLQIFDQ